MDDQAIEQEIQAKGKTAPRITPADIEANIASEHYFTANDGVQGAFARDDKNFSGIPVSDSLHLLTFCVLVLRNGFTVTGESACASPENFDADIGRSIARQNAVQKIWPLMGYLLKQELHGAAAPKEPKISFTGAISQLMVSAETCEINAPIQEAEGNHEQAALSRANAESYRAAIFELLG